MMNKKILAVAVASAFSFNATAAISLDTAANALTIATETYTTAAITVADAAVLDLTAISQVNVAPNTTIYVRFELTNATFGDTVVSSDLTVNAANTTNETIALVAGGAITDNYAVFSFVDTDTSLTTANVWTLATVDDYDITVAGTAVTSTYRVYLGGDASVNASNGVADSEFKSKTATIINFASGRTGTVTAAPAAEVKALVAKGFTTYDVANAATTSATLTNLGNLAVNAAAARSATAVDFTTLTAVTAAQVYDTTSTVSLAGDFSFGTFTLNDNANCGGTSRALTVATDKKSATAATADFTAASWYLCSNVGIVGTFPVGSTIPKVSSAYTVTLVDSAVTGNLGTIGYDTTSIQVDFLTTNSTVNQKVFLINNSTSPASYSTTFTTETALGVTAVGGTLASGTVPAQSMLTIKASELAVFTGGTRGSATIEIEADATNVQATTQTVTAIGSIDTVTLSVK